MHVAKILIFNFLLYFFDKIIMVIGFGIIKYRLYECHSLKEKRKIVKSIINRYRNNFNISVAEVGSNDIYHQTEIGFSLVSNNRMVINSKINKLFDLAENFTSAELINTEMEIMVI